MNGLSAWLGQLQYGKILEMVLSVAAALLCITIHETCHGFAAYALGDPTAKRAGRLSLNPIRHLDPMGLLCMAIFHFGWAKPVPINPGYFKHLRRDTAITAIAGPASNFVMAWLGMTLYYASAVLDFHLGQPGWSGYLCTFFLIFTQMNIVLGVFNLIPIPPLDGSKVLFSLLPDRKYIFLLRVERYGMLVMAVLLFTGILDRPLYWMQTTVVELLNPICQWPLTLYLRSL